MKLSYSPQRSDVPLSYSFSDEAITATQGGLADSFDFTLLPAGEAARIESTLSPCPVIGAERTAAGELIVTLRKHHGPNPTQAEAFPAEEIR